jgi:hypothetical protein
MMKRIFLVFTIAVLAGFLASGALAYTINDSSNDGIGSAEGYESYGINVLNFTPGTNSGNISFQLFTDYPQNGILTGSWATKPADLFITENYKGSNYLWAIPLVDHDSFTAGTMYAVGTYKISDNFDPGGGFTYNHNVPVWIDTLGNNYGYTSFGAATPTWTALSPGKPDYQVDVFTGIYEDDPNGKFCLLWGTATCANDEVQGCTAPIPGSLLLLGSGILGMMGIGIRRKSS